MAETVVLPVACCQKRQKLKDRHAVKKFEERENFTLEARLFFQSVV
jgi:hypothetical protein